VVFSAVAFALLRHLADGEIHSGAALAATVGVTRARVSQLLEEVEDAGLSLERVRGRGYRLLDATMPFNHAAIVRELGAHSTQLKVELVEHIDSTNSELLRRNPGAGVHRLLLVAEWQTAGRGRRGRQWRSIVGGSLTFSLGWRFEQGAGFLSGLPLAVGVAIVQALDASGCADVGLKWPNDLVHGRRKVGGILVELAGDALGPSLVVVGVGINVRLPDAVREDIAQPVTDLTAICGTVDRNVLVARIGAAVAHALERYACDGFAVFREQWQRRHALSRETVDVLLPDGSVVRGDVAGVDVDGALLLDSGGQRLRFVNGEVSLRGAGR
jgi:BirA family transcriptional regulator, biotin operon repressor / biotin---[acetyl-CoA-carboxylase] ligase